MCGVRDGFRTPQMTVWPLLLEALPPRGRSRPCRQGRGGGGLVGVPRMVLSGSIPLVETLRLTRGVGAFGRMGAGSARLRTPSECGPRLQRGIAAGSPALPAVRVGVDSRRFRAGPTFVSLHCPETAETERPGHSPLLGGFDIEAGRMAAQQVARQPIMKPPWRRRWKRGRGRGRARMVVAGADRRRPPCSARATDCGAAPSLGHRGPRAPDGS